MPDKWQWKYVKAYFNYLIVFPPFAGLSRNNQDLGKNFWLVESNDMNILYAGYAIKK